MLPNIRSVPTVGDSAQVVRRRRVGSRALKDFATRVLKRVSMTWRAISGGP
jgi:hypothetical protein